MCPELCLGRTEGGQVGGKGGDQSPRLFVIQREFVFYLSLVENLWSVGSKEIKLHDLVYFRIELGC